MAEGEHMKANIHPEVKDATATCACGATFQTKSKAKKTGNIEKFNKKFGLDKEQN